MRITARITCILTVLSVLASCSPNRKFEEEEKSFINQYTISHRLTTDSDAQGLYYIEKVKGNGLPIEVGDSIGVYYVMKYLDDTEVYSNINEETPLRCRVGSLGMIDGWTIGLTYMRGGGKAQFLLPSSLAYGSAGFGYYDENGKYVTIIESYTPLIYEIEVVEHFKATE